MGIRNWIAVVVMLGSWACAAAQEKQPVVEPHRMEVQVYEAGKKASFPELLPVDLSSLMSDKCDASRSGEVELSFIVDSDGQPHNVMFVHPIGNDLDRLAVVLAHANRFKPAMLNGSPVAVAVTDKIKLRGCAVAEKDAAGQDVHSLRFYSQPEQLLKAMKNAPEKATFSLGKPEPGRVGGTVTAPVAILTFDPQWSEEARKNGAAGECMIQIVVDAEGLPKVLKVMKPLGYGLDENAIEAVMRYRFKPGMRDGMPVSVYMTVAVNFRR
jgi:TonB family protein